MNRYTFVRSSIIAETFVVHAESEDEALDLVQNGHPSVEILKADEWIDWYDEEYTLASVEDTVL
jgi:PHD/YefM family antitoxin component YafN of YafNO toxin-antitoxin module